MRQRGLAGERGRRSRALQIGVAHIPSRGEPDQQRRRHGDQGCEPAAPRSLRSHTGSRSGGKQPLGDRLGQPRIERIAQVRVVAPGIRHPGGQGRIARQRVLDGGKARRVELTIRVRVEVGVGHGQRVHPTILI
jgi:hypothetical protein